MILNRVLLVDPNPSVYSDVSVDYGDASWTTVYDQDALTQKILMIIATPIGTRKWRPKFGSRIRSMLFEPFNNITASWIGSEVKSALESVYNGLSEDITNIKVVCKPDPTTDTYWVKIDWTEVKLSNQNSYQFNLDPKRA